MITDELRSGKTNQAMKREAGGRDCHKPVI